MTTVGYVERLLKIKRVHVHSWTRQITVVQQSHNHSCSSWQIWAELTSFSLAQIRRQIPQVHSQSSFRHGMDSIGSDCHGNFHGCHYVHPDVHVVGSNQQTSTRKHSKTAFSVKRLISVSWQEIHTGFFYSGCKTFNISLCLLKISKNARLSTVIKIDCCPDTNTEMSHVCNP